MKHLLLVTLAFFTSTLPAQSADQLKSDYATTRVGTVGLKFDYNHVLQPGTVLTVRIPGIYADPANTPQAIVGTVIVNNAAQQQRNFLSALSNTNQGRMLNVGEKVYISRLGIKADAVTMELLTADVPRYRAEVRFPIASLNNQPVSAIELILDAALTRPTQQTAQTTGPAGGQAQSQPQGLAPSMSRPGVAPISAEQQQHIQDLLRRVPASVATQVGEAAPTLETYLGLVSCINDYKGKSQLQSYLGPHGDLNAVFLPFDTMHYHDKGTCLNVTRLQGWTPLSLNAFEFQTVYTAADSGESTVRTHTAQKEPDGTWLMNR